MSLVDSDHIIPARTGMPGKMGRHGAHYYVKARKHDGKLVPSMTMYNETVNWKDKSCAKCLRTPWSNEILVCPKCGSMEWI